MKKLVPYAGHEKVRHGPMPGNKARRGSRSVEDVILDRIAGLSKELNELQGLKARLEARLEAIRRRN